MNVLSQFNHELLDSRESPLVAPDSFRACLNAHGLYNTLQFVLRLSPRVHRLINAAPFGVLDRSQIDFETVQAFSTYLHETVHWWQHMGSTAGFVVSLCYPTQSHSNVAPLREVLTGAGAKKSIKAWAENAALAGTSPQDSTLRAAHTAVNNALDVEFYKLFAMKPALAAELFRDRYFESIGHSYWMAYGHTLSLLSTTVDPDFAVLPDARLWDEKFPRLTERKVLGFYHGSPMIRGCEVGMQALFEGQARFIQLQYLAFGAFGDASCADIGKRGYFDGIYGEAFQKFLELSESSWPDRIDDPIIALFLLVCDLSLNPTRGFPLQIETYENFIVDADCGIRFVRFCQVIAQQHPELRSAITNYTRAEYESAATKLTAACGYDHPFTALREIVRWIGASPSLEELMREQETFDYRAENLPVRVLFSHFLAFSRDKLDHPEFYCWPGAWMAGHRAVASNLKLFLAHLSLFSDKEDDDGVFPREFPGKDPESIKRTFNAFFGNNIIYDLTRQWILGDGPFVYDYSWLSTAQPADGMTRFAKEGFEKLYGAHPDAFEVVVSKLARQPS